MPAELGRLLSNAPTLLLFSSSLDNLDINSACLATVLLYSLICWVMILASFN